MSKLEKIMKKLFKSYCTFCKYAGVFGTGMFVAGILEYGINSEFIFGIILALIVSVLPTLYLKKEEENHNEHW